MTVRTLATSDTSPADAFRTTGTSPGRSARVRVALDADHGGAAEVEVGYEVHGPPHAPVTLVLGGISADRHLAPTALRPEPGWWPGVVGRGAALDPGAQRLVGVDWIAPDLGRTVGTHDQARALTAVLDDLGVRRAAVVGASYGGMVGLALAERFPERVRALLVICAAHRTHPLATALRVIQRRTVRLGAEAGSTDAGLALGRALAMTTYRSAVEFDARFDWRPSRAAGAPRFPVEDYLDARGAAFAARFDPERFRRLSESIDLHAVEPERIAVPTTLVSFDTDALVPPWLADELAERAPGVRRHVTVGSVYGHDAFLKEAAPVSDAIRAALGVEVDR